MDRARCAGLVAVLAITMAVGLAVDSSAPESRRDGAPTSSLAASVDPAIPIAAVRTDAAPRLEQWAPRTTRASLAFALAPIVAACLAVLWISRLPHRKAGGAVPGLIRRHTVVLRAPPSFATA